MTPCCAKHQKSCLWRQALCLQWWRVGVPLQRKKETKIAQLSGAELWQEYPLFMEQPSLKSPRVVFGIQNQLKAESTINCYIFSLKYFQILTRRLIIYQIKWRQSAQRAGYTLCQLHCVKAWCKIGWRKQKRHPSASVGFGPGLRSARWRKWETYVTNRAINDKALICLSICVSLLSRGLEAFEFYSLPFQGVFGLVYNFSNFLW